MQGLLFLLLFALLLGLSACAGLPLDPASDPASGISGGTSPGQQDSADGAGSADAVRELVASSRTSKASGDYTHALADIERAIRIEPRNPYLWLELGEIHLARNDPRQAGIMAKKAMSIAGPDEATQAAAEDLLQRASR